MKLTKRSVESLAIPVLDKPYYKLFRDDQLKGFTVRITSEGVKTFILDKKIKNKLVRVTIGRFGDITAEEARDECQKLIGQYLTGRDPVKEQKNQKQQGISLRQVLEDYLNTRKNLKPATIKEYRSAVNKHFAHWLDQPMTTIDKDMVSKLHAKIGAGSQSMANKIFKILSVLFNFAVANYENAKGDCVITENPVIRLSQTRAWYPRHRRRTKITVEDLPAWFKAVKKLHNPSAASIANSVKHYLLLLLFTGLRREEAMPLIWAEYKSKDADIAKTEHLLDLKTKTIYIPDPKNREPHWLPLSDYLYDLFVEHKRNTQSKYVFPSATGDNHIKEPKKIVSQVIANSGIKFMLHDLRRTFASVAESLDISAYALKRLLNHKIINSDVTAGYIVSDTDRLKVPMQKITDRLLELSTVS